MKSAGKIKQNHN